MTRASWFCLLPMMAWAMSGCRSLEPVIVTAADHGRTIELQPEQTIIIELESNPGTGYSWAMAQPASTLLTAEEDAVYIPRKDGGAAIGSGGMTRWRLRAIRRGRETIRLDYRRPWEQETVPVRSVRYEIFVR
jgi:inhibitor of cysteine peptidase